jgi:hypothetical protein
MLLEFDDNKLLKEQIEIAYACSNVQDPFAWTYTRAHDNFKRSWSFWLEDISRVLVWILELNIVRT